jgi:hypothetical protein
MVNAPTWFHYLFGTGGIAIVIVTIIGLYLRYKASKKPDYLPREETKGKIIKVSEIINPPISNYEQQGVKGNRANSSAVNRKKHSEFVSELIGNSPSDDEIHTKEIDPSKYL